ncbi:MAG: hypothetical protein ACREBG_22035 [Pyrinomonadaceae bacterium]
MRIAYPTVTDQGFGNNLIAVAKAYLIAQTCEMNYLQPIWPRNLVPPLHGYDYYFPATVPQKIETGLFSYMIRAQRKLGLQIGFPALYFDRHLYGRTGITDAGEACLAYLKTLGLDDRARSLVVTTSGMWGGYASIKRARAWLRDLVLSHSDTRRRFKEMSSPAQGRLKVAVDIKFGAYATRTKNLEENERNIRLPLDWYTRICQKIREVSDCAFILSTDAKREELQPFLNEIEPINYLGQTCTDLMGLMIMMHSDLVICSNSTYSRLGCFLNDKPYLWIADTLVKDRSGPNGYLWPEGEGPMPAWFKPAVKSTNEREDLDAIRRCFAVSYDFPALPEGLKRYLASNATLPIEVDDDLLYGESVYLT